MKKYNITYYDINFKIDHDIKTLAENKYCIRGEISSDLYRSVQCDIEKCGFDSLKLEQNRWKCDKLVYKQ